MTKLKFKTKDKEIEFFKKIPYFNTVENAGIKFAEMVSDLDLVEKGMEEKDDG